MIRGGVSGQDWRPIFQGSTACAWDPAELEVQLVLDAFLYASSLRSLPDPTTGAEEPRRE